MNIYMAHGGTNYGFSSSADVDAKGLEIVYTSYDYDALISESGDITNKYHAIRNVIEKYLPIPNIGIPRNESKMVLPPIQLRPRTTLFSFRSRHFLGSDVRQSSRPLLFENFIQDAGFLLYETQLDGLHVNPSMLYVTGLHDRAIVYLNNVSQHTLHLEHIQRSFYNENLFHRHLLGFYHERKRSVHCKSIQRRGIFCKFWLKMLDVKVLEL